MFSLPGTIALIVFFLVRLQEIVPAFHAISVTHLMIVGLVGLAIDIRLGRVQLPRSGFAKSSLFFIVWSFIAEAVQLRNGIAASVWTVLASSYGLFFLIALGAQSLRSLRVVIWVFVGCILFATVIAVHQGTEPLTCMVSTADGVKPAPGPPQQCEFRRDCEVNSQMEPDVDFECERVGLLGTASVFGRVRYLGLLEDPNELAWVVTMMFPMLLWLVDRWATTLKVGTILLVFALGAVCVIMTQSRSGQLSFLLVIGALTWRRLGVKGLIAAALLGLPVLMLGGRDGEGAESSSIERLGCWSAGISIWRGHPLLGVGPLQFQEYHYLTAHNSYVLTLAEGGPLLLFAWMAMFWLLFRSLSLARGWLVDQPSSREPASLATMLSAATAPTVLSAFFLSMAYKPALWAGLGIVAAFETTVYSKLRQEPARIRLRDAFGVVALSITVIVAIYFYLRMKGID